MFKRFEKLFRISAFD